MHFITMIQVSIQISKPYSAIIKILMNRMIEHFNRYILMCTEEYFNAEVVMNCNADCQIYRR